MFGIFFNKGGHATPPQCNLLEQITKPITWCIRLRNQQLQSRQVITGAVDVRDQGNQTIARYVVCPSQGQMRCQWSLENKLERFFTIILSGCTLTNGNGMHEG